MKNFWEEMKHSGKPILALAPMADVTDSAFRHTIAKYSKVPGASWYPYITWTEFVSADGLARAPEEGRKKLLKDLEYTEIERPIVAQFFTSNPKYMKQAAALALELGFDGVDINMGCPDRNIEKQNAGAALIKTPELARELIRAAKEGVEGKIPVSVKTRLGFNEDTLDTWLPELLKENPAAITLHLRTRKEMSKVDAHWDRMKRAVEIRNEVQGVPRVTLGTHTLILGNGDVKDVVDAYKKIEETGCDGVMMGRAVFGNPFLFRTEAPTLTEKLEALKEHIELFEKNLGGIKSFALMKKHFKSYLLGFEGTHELKDQLMTAENSEEASSIISQFLIQRG